MGKKLNSDVLPQSSGIGAFILDPERLHAIADEHRDEGDQVPNVGERVDLDGTAGEHDGDHACDVEAH